MEYRFIGDALRVAGDCGEKNFQAAQLVMLQRVDMLGHVRRGRPAKMKREKLHLWRKIILDYVNQFERDRSDWVLLDFKLAVQVLAENLGVHIIQRRWHRNPQPKQHRSPVSTGHGSWQSVFTNKLSRSWPKIPAPSN